MAKVIQMNMLQAQPTANMIEEPLLDAIRTEYHPHINVRPKLEVIGNITRNVDVQLPGIPPSPGHLSEAAQSSNFAEFALDAALNKHQVNTLLKLFHHCINGKDNFELYDHGELTEMWDIASVLHTRSVHSICHVG